jgi:regulator of cell morphogenesis and NO signaling
MKSDPIFNQIQKSHFKTLAQYVPVVAKVHGGSHPEFHEVRALFDAISEKAKLKGQAKPDLAEEFAKLREITKDYTVPEDVCESYEAVYQMLAELDEAYRASIK